MRARLDHAGAVLVITGKGRREADGSEPTGAGVLRRRLPQWLSDPDLRVHVSGFAPAHRDHGGAGAWYVFLRRPTDHGGPFR